MHSEGCVERSAGTGPSKNGSQVGSKKKKKTAFSLVGSLQFPCLGVLALMVMQSVDEQHSEIQ